MDEPDPGGHGGLTPAQRSAYRSFVRTHHPDRGGDPEVFRAGLAGFAKLVADHRSRSRRMGWGFVLDDLERSQPRALIAAPAKEQPPVRRRRKQDGTGG